MMQCTLNMYWFPFETEYVRHMIVLEPSCYILLQFCLLVATLSSDSQTQDLITELISFPMVRHVLKRQNIEP